MLADCRKRTVLGSLIMSVSDLHDKPHGKHGSILEILEILESGDDSSSRYRYRATCVRSC